MGGGERERVEGREDEENTLPPHHPTPPLPTQTLLNFYSKRRLLITGTPLQNDLMELWSLMHFLMPHVFASHAAFRDWFSQPLTAAVEGAGGSAAAKDAAGRALVKRLHSVLRPFLLRRLKADVEKSLPPKHEHILRVTLSRRQRALYEDYLASSAASGALTGGGFLGAVNVLMQLRKVCNHPDLFEARPIVSALDAPAVVAHWPATAARALEDGGWGRVDDVLAGAALLDVRAAAVTTAAGAAASARLAPPAGAVAAAALAGAVAALDAPLVAAGPLEAALPALPNAAAVAAADVAAAKARVRAAAGAAATAATLEAVSVDRLGVTPALGTDGVAALTLTWLPAHARVLAASPRAAQSVPSFFVDAVRTPADRAADLDPVLRRFVCVIPRARAPPPELWCSTPAPAAAAAAAARAAALAARGRAASAPLHTAAVRATLFFPDKRLIQFDCGKLQALATLLRDLKAGGHRVLIFTQMSRMLDILEAFLGLHGHTYVRLDGGTKPEARQVLMQRFNANPKIFAFILSTRSGGVGMNLTGADTVVFYDADWNPAMDAQAQDRCHRIGQVRVGLGERGRGWCLFLFPFPSFFSTHTTPHPHTPTLSNRRAPSTSTVSSPSTRWRRTYWPSRAKNGSSTAWPSSPVGSRPICWPGSIRASCWGCRLGVKVAVVAARAAPPRRSWPPRWLPPKTATTPPTRPPRLPRRRLRRPSSRRTRRLKRRTAGTTSAARRRRRRAGARRPSNQSLRPAPPRPPCPPNWPTWMPPCAPWNGTR